MKSARQVSKECGEMDTPIEERLNRYSVPIIVRMKYGSELNGIRSHEDGVSFHSSSPIPEGKMVELILCGGTILVDAEIVECRPIIDSLGGFALRAKYVHASEDMRELIAEEVGRHETESSQMA